MGKIEELSEALCNVRKAHRIIYSYQQRMLSLMKFISAKLNFVNKFMGVKHFSNDIYKKRDGYLEIHENMWAWDFLYSYVFEYYLGEQEIEGGDGIAISVVQFSDTGFFDSNSNNKTDVSTFAPEEKSASKLLFIIERKPKTSDWLWNIKEIVNNKEYASREHTCSILEQRDGIKQCLYSFDITDFTDEKSAVNSLRKLCNYCKEKEFADIKIV